MKAHLIAHNSNKQDGSLPHIQTLEQHSRNVALHCAALCRPFGMEKLGRLTGKIHDLGKSSHCNQDHLLRQTPEKLNHSAAGMRWLWEQAAGQSTSIRLAGQMAALAIGCHHSGRCDYLSLDGSQPWLERMCSEQAQPLYQESVDAFFSDCCREEEIQQLLREAGAEVASLYKKAASILPEGGV